MSQKRKPAIAAKVETPAAPGRGGRLGRWAAILALLLVFAAVVAYVNWPSPDAVPTAARMRVFIPARVTAVLEDDALPDTWTEGQRIGTQLLELKLLRGEYRGQVFTAANYLTAYANVDARVGTRLIVRMDLDESGNAYVASIPNYDRGPVLGGLVLVFAALLVVIGGWKGVKALLGLIFTLVCIWSLLIPLIEKGASPILTSAVIVALTAAVSLLLLSGVSAKTFCAILGCIGGVAAAGVAAALVGVITPLTGFNMSEAEELVLRGSGMSISGLLVCGILISSLGAVMDVAMSIASACNELHELNPTLTVGQLFRSGMNIGRDAMGTMANTLILAFAGSALNMLLLFQVFDYPMLQIINSDLMAIEILQGVAGSIGIILTVPLVALVSARIMGRAAN